MAFVEFQSSILCTGLFRGDRPDNFRFLSLGSGGGAAAVIGFRYGLIAVNIGTTKEIFLTI